MNISHNNKISHIKKHSCVLYNNSINKIHLKIKQRFLEQTYSSTLENENNNYENIYMPLHTSISNNKKSLEKTKTLLFSRPYIKQLSRYSFLALKNKNYNNNNNNNNYKRSENRTKSSERKKSGVNPDKDDKKNIYFNLIKTYYDENGIKLKPKEIEINPINNEIDYPKIIKAKKKKKEISMDKIDKGNTLNFEKRNKTMNNNCNIYFAEIDHNEKQKNFTINKLITHKKIIKRGKNNKLNLHQNINNTNYKQQSTISPVELMNNGKIKYVLTSPNKSEKYFNKFFHHKYKSSNTIVNKEENNSIINTEKNTLINNTLEDSNINNDTLYKYKNYSININNIPFSNRKESEEKNKFDIMNYFNKRISNHKRTPTFNIKGPQLIEGLNSFNSSNIMNTQIYSNVNNGSNLIFHKKKISDSFDEIKIIKKQLDQRNKIMENNLCPYPYDSISNRNGQLHSPKFCLNSGIKHNHTTLSFHNSKDDVNDNKNKKLKISPKSLEKYFNPNQINNNDISYKTHYYKPPSEIEVIDINNITFKKPFKTKKNNKTVENNSVNVNFGKENCDTDINSKNKKNVILSSYTNKINKKNEKLIGRNISYNFGKQKLSSSSVSNNNKILNKNSLNTINSMNIKYMKNIFKQNPYSFSNEKLNTSRSNMIENRSFITPYYARIYNYQNDKNKSKNIEQEKMKKYIIQRYERKVKKYNFDTSYSNTKNNIILSPTNKKSSTTHKIAITEPSVLSSGNEMKIKKLNMNKLSIDIKNEYRKLLIEKEKKGNKRTYILKRKSKNGSIKVKNKCEVKNKLGIKKGK